jgi:hypothetical protein
MAVNVDAPAAERVVQLRRASLAALVMLIIQYGIGIGVNIYVKVPKSDGMGKVFSNGPAVLTVHILVGLLLVLSAIGLLVQAIVAHSTAMIATAAVALLAIVGAAFSGTSFLSDGKSASSMAMAVLTGVAMLCYVLNLYLLGPARTAKLNGRG